MLDTFFWIVGVMVTIVVGPVVLWLFLIKPFYHAMRVASIQAGYAIFKEIPEEIKKDMHPLDKLWIVPRLFRREFASTFMAYLDGREVHLYRLED